MTLRSTFLVTSVSLVCVGLGPVLSAQAVTSCTDACAPTTVFNRRPMSLGVNYYYNVEWPDGAAAQQLRFVVTLLYPR